MRRLDRLIILELIGPWLFGVAIFTSLIFASLLLMRITNWVVRGVPLELVSQLVLLLVPGIIVKTFPMAMLLATLLGFGRLSNDSEIVAVRAAGASVFRIMKPVLIISLVVALGSFVVNEAVVPPASFRATSLQQNVKETLSKSKEAQAVHYVIRSKDGTSTYLGAMDIDLATGTLLKVHLIAYDQDGKPAYVFTSAEMQYTSQSDWRIIGGGNLIELATMSETQFDGDVWPAEIPKPDVTPSNLLAGIVDDLDTFSITEISREIRKMRANPEADQSALRNLEFGFYNKIALPLAVVIFALLGAPLGIRSHRAGVAVGFAISIGLSFAYLTLVNFMSVYSRAGQIPPFVASFTPVLLGLAAALVTIYKKNA